MRSRFPHHAGTGSPKDLGTKILGTAVPRSLVPRFWYHDLGTKILVPGSWYQDLGTKIASGELERRSLSKIERGGAMGCRPSPEVWGLEAPPRTAGSLGGGSSSVQTILWYCSSEGWVSISLEVGNSNQLFLIKFDSGSY